MSHANKRPEQLNLLDRTAGKGEEVAAAGYKGKYWLGLTTDHRRLFEALQDGWLRLLPSSAGQLLGVGSFPTEQDTCRAKHAISVRMEAGCFDAAGMESISIPWRSVDKLVRRRNRINRYRTVLARRDSGICNLQPHGENGRRTCTPDGFGKKRF